MNTLKFLFGHWRSQFSKSDDKKSLEQLLHEAKEFYNLIIPGNVDKDTFMSSCETEEKRLIFNCTLTSIEKSELEDDIDHFTTTLKDILKVQAQKTRRLGRILNKGGSIEYNYQDKNDDHVTTITL